jgi:hypothetical protein
MTKRGQNRLVQITLHVHTHTIGGYEEGVNRLGAALGGSCAESVWAGFAANLVFCKGLAQKCGVWVRSCGV